MTQPAPSLRRTLSWPNRISLFRLLAVPPFVVLLLNQQDLSWARHAALALFVVLGLSDALDGFLARRYGQITRLGKIVDPLADKALVTCAVILLATRAGAVRGVELPNWVVVAVVGKDLWVVLGYLVLFLVMGPPKVRPTLFGKAATATQILLISAVLIAPDIDRLAPGWRPGTYLALGLGWVVVVLCVLAVASYARVGVRLVQQDEARQERGDASESET